MTRSLSAIPLSLLLASCVSAPTTTPQEAKLSAKGAGLGAASAPALSERWWDAFHDPVLDSLVAEALNDNPTLHAALARMREAQSALSANEAASYPQVSFDAQEQRERFSRNYIIPPPFGGTTQWIGTVEANLSWNIDLWGRQAALIDEAGANAAAAADDEAAARLALSGAVVDAYINLGRAQALASIARQNADDRARILSLTTTRFENGLENAASAKDAEALLSQANEDVTRADAAREVLVHELTALTGRGADAYAAIRIPSSPPSATLELPSVLPADLLARRPDIAAAESRIDAATAGRRSAHADFYPDINLLAFAGWAAVGLSPMFSGSALTYGAGPAVHLPIFDAGELRAKYAGATASLDAAVAQYNAAVLQAVRETSDALTQLHSVEAQRPDEERALADAETSFSLAESRYRSGLSDRVALLEAEDTLLRARQDKADLDAGDATSRVALVMALGGGFSRAGGVPASSIAAKKD